LRQLPGDLGKRKNTPMSMGQEGKPSGSTSLTVVVTPAGESLRKEFLHLRAHWCWFFALGVLLAICVMAAIVFPAITLLTSVAIVVLLGVSLMVAGVATIVATVWAGHWSGHLLQLLIGLFYLVAGFLITDTPVKSTVAITAVIAAIFIVAGLFRVVAAFAVRFPHWEWSVLNGGITFLLGLVIYRHFPQSALWVIGLLVGIEMLLNGWTWIMLSLAIKRIPDRVV
jgi:uncharacterized membrane protein HdeD (DUF308 family)